MLVRDSYRIAVRHGEVRGVNSEAMLVAHLDGHRIARGPVGPHRQDGVVAGPRVAETAATIRGIVLYERT